MKDAVKVFRDGREVCAQTVLGRREYQRRIRVMWERQRGLCCICKVPISLMGATFEHQEGRGMGGGHRDDRIEKDGKLYNGVACLYCNWLKGSRRMEYN